MKKWFTLVLALLLLLSGCAAQPEQTVPTVPTQPQPTQVQQPQDPEKFRVELTLWVTEQSIWAKEELLTEMLDSFADYYPNISVEVIHLSTGALTGQLPDLLLSDTGDLTGLAREGKLRNLDALWAPIDDEYAGVREACTGEDGFFAVPLCVVADCMAVRAADFAEAEADTLINTVSHTWNGGNFLKAASNLFEAGKKNPLSLYCKDTAGDVYTRLLVENLGGGRYVKTLNNTYQIDSDDMVHALKNLYGAPGVVLRPDLDSAGALEEFLRGDSSMVLNWNSALQLQHGGSGEIVYMLYPSGGRSRVYGKVYALAACATGDARREAASMTLAAFLRDSQEAVRATGQLPARKSGLDAYTGTAMEKTVADLSKLLAYLEKGEIPGSNWEKARKEWVDLLKRLAEGEDLMESIEICRAALEK